MDNDAVDRLLQNLRLGDPEDPAPQGIDTTRANAVLVVVNLDPRHPQSGWVDLDLDALGLAQGVPFEVHDLLTGRSLRMGGHPQLRHAGPGRGARARPARAPPRRLRPPSRCPGDHQRHPRRRSGAGALANDPRPRSSGRSSDWYKDAVIYELHVRAFHDSDGDGIGDFPGLIEKLDYLQELGVTALWLLPFYPSPLRDDGYDISDYRRIHPSYGSLRDFRSFLREAHRRGLRVITELVLAHTSDEHPWFQRARQAAPGTVHRDFYVWSDTPDRYRDARVIFKDFESSNWTFDPVAHAYYWHRFYSHQPSLNYDNPAVRAAMFDVVDYWLGMGVDGLRLDAVPYLYAREGTSCENLPETFAFLRDLRRHVDERFAGRMLLAEANQWPEDAVAYMGKGDMCHMAFHFPLMPRMFMAARQEDRFPIVDILAETRRYATGLPVGALPPQPRRAHARDGDRRRAGLHVPGLRPGSPGEGERRHPAATRPACSGTTAR